MSLSTVYRELERGKCIKRRKKYDCYGLCGYENIVTYSADIAEERAKMEMTRKGAPIKLGKDFAFAEYVEKRVMKDKISPCVLVGEMKKSGKFNTNVSKSTLYRYISRGFFLHLRMKHLPYFKKKKHYRKRRFNALRAAFPLKNDRFVFSKEKFSGIGKWIALSALPSLLSWFFPNGKREKKLFFGFRTKQQKALFML